jgi:hypothetical protein
MARRILVHAIEDATGGAVHDNRRSGAGAGRDRQAGVMGMVTRRSMMRDVAMVTGFGGCRDAGPEQSEHKGRQGRARLKAALNATLEHTNQSRFSSGQLLQSSGKGSRRAQNSGAAT